MDVEAILKKMRFKDGLQGIVLNAPRAGASRSTDLRVSVCT